MRLLHGLFSWITGDFRRYRVFTNAALSLIWLLWVFNLPAPFNYRVVAFGATMVGWVLRGYYEENR